MAEVTNEDKKKEDKKEANCKDCKDCREKPPARWREDFPVTWESDNYITRREMVKFLALGSLTIAGANFMLAGVPHLVKAAAMPRTRIGLASSLGLPANGDPSPSNAHVNNASLNNASLNKPSSALFRYPTADDPCIIVRKADGSLVAYSQVCTHLSCAVIHDASHNTLFCPCHNGFFTIDEGRPYAGPPTRRLPRILLEQQGDEIFAVGVEV